jgi:VanZ family protein
MLLIVTAVVLQGLKTRPGNTEIGVALGIAAVYLMVFLRMAIQEERTHLIEYSVLGLIIHEALTERGSQGRRVPIPALLAVVLTSLLGLIDEGLQAILPNRVYDIRDVGFNALAGLMAVVASLALAWARRRRGETHPD